MQEIYRLYKSTEYAIDEVHKMNKKERKYQ